MARTATRSVTDDRPSKPTRPELIALGKRLVTCGGEQPIRLEHRRRDER
jgi:hypothetical protein